MLAFTGAEAATLKIGYPKVQASFREVARSGRTPTDAMKANAHVLGKDAQFACVVCKLKRGETDRVVQTRSQWPEDLQKSGVPAVLWQNQSHLKRCKALTPPRASPSWCGKNHTLVAGRS